MNSFGIPSIYIVRQDSLGKENFSKNEIQKEVHVVSKNLPFLIELGSFSLNFHRARLSARLHYDAVTDQPFKQVDYVKQEPMTYKTFINEDGDRATVEIRILVLSSQHEDSNFVLKIGAIDSNTNLAYEVFSEPMRVVSKPSLVNKKKTENKRKFEAGAPSTEDLNISPSASPSSANARQAKSDAVLSSLARMEQQQKRILDRLLSFPTHSPVPDPSENEFEDAFRKLLASYQKIKTQDRPGKLRKAILESSFSSQDIGDFLSETATVLTEEPSTFPQENLFDDVLSSSSQDFISLYSDLLTPPSSDF